MSIELPDGRISRTLPEQVGFNSKKIKEIIDLLNTSDITTKLIDLGTVESPIEGTLTAAQREIADLPVAFIKLNDRLYLKAVETNNALFFIDADVESEVELNRVQVIFNRWIAITKATNGWQYRENTIAETYDPDTIADFLALKADLTGATFTGAVKAQTLEQTNPNWSLAVEPVLPAAAIAKGFTITNIYNRLLVINNVLFLVMINKINNPTASAIALDNTDSIQFEAIFPESIGEKIYDISGKKVSESGSDNIDLNYSAGAIQTGVGYSNFRLITTHAGQNQIRFVAERVGAMTVNAGNSVNVFVRNFLLLL